MTINNVEQVGGNREKTESLASRLRWWLLGPKPIGFLLFLLIALIIIPAFAISTVLLQRNHDAQREVVNTLAEAMAGSIAEAVDRELSGMMTTLRVLSTTPSLAEDRLDDFYTRAKSALGGTGSYLIVLDENNDQLLNTRVPYGTALGPTSDPGSVRDAMAARTATISGVFHGETSQEWVFNVILPFLRENRPPRALVMTRNAETMTDTLSQQMLRGGWNATLVDSSGTVIASSFMSTNTGKPFFLELNGEPVPQTVTSQDGESYVAIADESNYSGWKVVVWSPTAAVEQPMRDSLRQLLGGSLIIIAIATVAAWALGRQIAKTVRGLAQAARRLGAGERVEAQVYPITEVNTVSAALAEAAHDRKQAEGEISLLMREVAHRAKNQLTVVASMAKQTARNARSLPAFLDSFQKRLYGLARSTDLLIVGGAAGVELHELVHTQLEPFRPEDDERLILSGPPFRLANQAAQTIGMAVHELATNAAKYGAFASRTGRLSVTWSVEDDKLVLVWREHVTRLRRRPIKPGFGTEIVDRMLGGTLDAEIDRTFHRDGMECVFRIPRQRIVPVSPQVSTPA